MLTVVLSSHVDKVRSYTDEHLPGARLRYNAKKGYTAIQHEDFEEMGDDGLRSIARAHQLPLVTIVEMKAFASG